MKDVYQTRDELAALDKRHDEEQRELARTHNAEIAALEDECRHLFEYLDRHEEKRCIGCRIRRNDAARRQHAVIE